MLLNIALNAHQMLKLGLLSRRFRGVGSEVANGETAEAI
jgi:hypothetical protein